MNARIRFGVGYVPFGGNWKDVASMGGNLKEISS